MTDAYLVVGDPISHSKSPQIHHQFAEVTGESIDYKAQRIATGNFVKDVTDFFQKGGRGLNITVPYKQEAWEFADELTDRAKRAGAVNTLVYQSSGTILGDTTDGVGLVTDLITNQDVSLKGKRILVLGAGGAVRGVIQPILEESPTTLVIANRTVSKADELAEDFKALGPIVSSAFENVKGPFDVIINGTSASLKGDLPPLPAGILAENACCYDMMYGAEPTLFMQWSLEQGAAKAVDGLGMLVEQAAESFFLWRGVRPATRPVIALIREQLTAS